MEVPEFWSSLSWIALPWSIWVMWESAQVTRKSCRNVAGRPQTQAADTRTHRKRTLPFLTW